LTKLNQVLIRSKIRKIENRKIFESKISINRLIKKKKEFVKNVEIERLIEQELLNRLHMGVYGKNYMLRPIQYWQKIKNKAPINIVNLDLPGLSLCKI
jgi:hypothetical protein